MPQELHDWLDGIPDGMKKSLPEGERRRLALVAQECPGGPEEGRLLSSLSRLIVEVASSFTNDLDPYEVLGVAVETALESIRTWDPDGGRGVHSWMRRCVKQRLVSAVRDARAQKRDPGSELLSLDQSSPESEGETSLHDLVGDPDSEVSTPERTGHLEARIRELLPWLPEVALLHTGLWSPGHEPSPSAIDPRTRDIEARASVVIKRDGCWLTPKQIRRVWKLQRTVLAADPVLRRYLGLDPPADGTPPEPPTLEDLPLDQQLSLDLTAA